MNSSTENNHATIGRRSFLKGAAAGVAGLAALSACSPSETKSAENGSDTQVQQAPAEEVYQGICRGNCGGGCIMNVHVRESKVVKTSAIHQPDEDGTRICQRGLSQVQRIYAPERLQYPMRPWRAPSAEPANGSASPGTRPSPRSPQK